MSDRATPNLPSDLGSTAALYARLGFSETWRDDGWMVLDRGDLRLHPPREEDWGGRVGALIDPDGTLLRLVQN